MIDSPKRIGIISDLHCNAAAVERALALMGPIDTLVCAGDAIDQSRFSNEVVDLLRRHEALTVQGNHEAHFFAPHGWRAQAGQRVSREHSAWLAHQPRRMTFDHFDTRVLIAHANSWDEGFDYVFPHSPDFHRFGEAEADIVIYGHTHLPVVQQVGSTLVINPGSTGQGRPTESGFRFGCAVLQLPTREVQLIEFDPIFN